MGVPSTATEASVIAGITLSSSAGTSVDVVATVPTTNPAEVIMVLASAVLVPDAIIGLVALLLEPLLPLDAGCLAVIR